MAHSKRSVSSICVSCTRSVAFFSAFTCMSSSGLHSSAVKGVRGDCMMFVGPMRNQSVVLTCHMSRFSQSSVIFLLSHVSPCHGGGMCQQAWVQIQTALLWLLWILLGWQSSYGGGVGGLTLHQRGQWPSSCLCGKLLALGESCTPHLLVGRET